MKNTIIRASVFAYLVLACAPSNAQQAWLVPPSDDRTTPVQQILKNDLAMPGVGLEATKKQITNRLQYALDHEWMTSEQVEQLKGELKAISDKEAADRDAEGKLPFESKVSLANQLFKLNAKFEDLALKEEKQKLKVASKKRAKDI